MYVKPFNRHLGNLFDHCRVIDALLLPSTLELIKLDLD